MMNEELESEKSQPDELSDYFSDDYELDSRALGLKAVRNELKKFVLRPFLIGVAAAFGMSVGYTLFDWTQSVLSRKSS